MTGLALGEKLTLRKPHPCGGTEWVVMRTGADVKIRCVTCGRSLMLGRSELEKRVRPAKHGARRTAT
ncbi:MAG: DUF951 domain-containing protein [SAR202 cluster bacterium]|nr:DUF951 domain-containing protein [SAR202 cluster bacterium]